MRTRGILFHLPTAKLSHVLYRTKFVRYHANREFLFALRVTWTSNKQILDFCLLNKHFKSTLSEVTKTRKYCVEHQR